MLYSIDPKSGYRFLVKLMDQEDKLYSKYCLIQYFEYRLNNYCPFPFSSELSIGDFVANALVSSAGGSSLVAVGGIVSVGSIFGVFSVICCS